MRDFLICLIYLASTGAALFVIGRLVPKRRFCYANRSYRPLRFERQGRLYEALGVRGWKDRLPDMSRLLPDLIPSKRPPQNASAAQIERMIQETCVAEWAHKILCLLGFGCVFLWKRVGGWIVALLYAIGNLPFIIVQRYNRPKLVQLLYRLKKKERGECHEKLLILSCGTGQGHNSCAQAVKEYYDGKNMNCIVRDSLAFVSTRFAGFISWGHSFVYRHIPGLFRWGFQYSENHPAIFRENSVVYNILASGAERMYQCIIDGGYETVVCTHVFSAITLTHMLKLHPMPLQTAFIATDYASYPGVESTDLQCCFIPHETLSPFYRKQGVPKERIFAAGLPVRRSFFVRTPQAEARRRLSISEESKLMLMMGGSMGCGSISRILRTVAKNLPEDAEVAVICGTNRRLLAKLNRRYGGQKQIHLVGYTNQVPLYMDAADLYLTKPGGISVTEAAAKCLPMVFLNAVAGCETYNMDFFTKLGGAVAGDSPEEVAGQAVRILRSDSERRRMRKALEAYHQLDGAAQIYRKLNRGTVA